MTTPTYQSLFALLDTLGPGAKVELMITHPPYDPGPAARGAVTRGSGICIAGSGDTLGDLLDQLDQAAADWLANQ